MAAVGTGKVQHHARVDVCGDRRLPAGSDPGVIGKRMPPGDAARMDGHFLAAPLSKRSGSRMPALLIGGTA